MGGRGIGERERKRERRGVEDEERTNGHEGWERGRWGGCVRVRVRCVVGLSHYSTPDPIYSTT